MFSIKDLVAKGVSMEDIIALKEEYDRDQEKSKASAEASAKYYADKELHGGSCVTCGCKLAVSNTSGYCRKHVAKAILTKAPEEKAPKPKYVTKTYYGVRSNDLMDHAYYQGGAQGTSRKR